MNRSMTGKERLAIKRTIWKHCTGVLLCVLLLLLLTVPAAAAVTDDFPEIFGDGPVLQAHRGLCSEYPENSIAAFNAAAQLEDVGGIETDIQITADGVLVCMHDSTLDRTTDGTGNVSDYTLSQLQKVHLDGGWGWDDSFDGKLTIPTLQQFLDICKQYGKTPYIEIKQTDTEIINLLLSQLSDGGWERHAVLISLKYDALSYVGTRTKDYPLEYMPDSAAEADLMEKVSALPNGVLRIDCSDLNDSLKKKAAAAGVPLETYTINAGDYTTLQRVMEYGIIGAVSNYYGGYALSAFNSDEKPDSSGSFGSGLTWSRNGETLTISGSGAIPDYRNAESLPWADFAAEIQVIHICPEVTAIGANAFCSCVNLRCVTLTTAVTKIGQGAFSGCNSLKTVYAAGSQPELPTIPTGTDNAALNQADWHYIPCSPFTDVKNSSAYYYAPVLWAVSAGITNGTSDTTFSPSRPCTRAQLVTFLWRAAGSPVSDIQNPFSDVKADSYYYQAVLWAVQHHITKGTTDTTFSPYRICSRAQTVTFLWRAAGSPEMTGADNPYSDVSRSSYYCDAVLWAVQNEITNGTGGGTFSPDDSCTRGQIVTFLYRAGA